MSKRYQERKLTGGGKQRLSRGGPIQGKGGIEMRLPIIRPPNRGSDVFGEHTNEDKIRSTVKDLLRGLKKQGRVSKNAFDEDISWGGITIEGILVDDGYWHTSIVDGNKTIEMAHIGGKWVEVEWNSSIKNFVIKKGGMVF